LFSELQEHDKRKSVTQDRVLAERHHWAGHLSKCRDKYKHILIEREVASAQSMASKDAVIEKLQRDLQFLTQSLIDQEEDTECLLFAHRQSLRELRSIMGRTIESKQDTIKRLRAQIVDQGEMCYKMIDEVNEHRNTAKLMKERADESAEISIARQNKNKAATDTIQSLQDQLADMCKMSKDMHKLSEKLRDTSNKNKCRIMELEEETMDLMNTIHVST
jgi:hypothetical protein